MAKSGEIIIPYGDTVPNTPPSGKVSIYPKNDGSINYKTSDGIEHSISTGSGSGGGTTDHSELDNLGYESSGHTGFQPAGDYATNTQLNTTSGVLQNEIDTIFDNVDYIQFDISKTGTTTEGRMTWDSTEVTPVVGIVGGYQLPLFKSIFKRVRNVGDVTMNVGDFVYTDSIQGEIFAKVKLACANSVATSYVLGSIFQKSIEPNQFGIAVEFGYNHGMNTLGLEYNTPLWLSATTSGGYTQTRPDAPNTSVFLGYVLRQSSTDGSIVQRPTVIPRLSMLSDIYSDGSYSDNDTVLWDNDNSRFKIDTISGTHNHDDRYYTKAEIDALLA